MARAVAPKAIPELPEGFTDWRRSLRRGSVFHANSSGVSACRTIAFDRNASRAADNLGDLQYWGVCPRCLAAAKRNPQNNCNHPLAP